MLEKSLVWKSGPGPCVNNTAMEIGTRSAGQRQAKVPLPEGVAHKRGHWPSCKKAHET